MKLTMTLQKDTNYFTCDKTYEALAKHFNNGNPNVVNLERLKNDFAEVAFLHGVMVKWVFPEK